MFLGYAGVLIAAASLGSSEPVKVTPEFARTNEFLRAIRYPDSPIAGTFVQRKHLATGEDFVSSGVFSVDPGKTFEWRILEPFDSLFHATKEKYVYSNEDECVEKALSELRGYSQIASVLEAEDAGDALSDAYEAMYTEEGGVSHVLARPRDSRMKRVLSRVEIDGTWSNLVFLATFPDRSTFEIKVKAEKCR